MHEPEGNDNYLAEMAAMMDSLAAEEEGGRIVVVFDATSPVHAMIRFRHAHVWHAASHPWHALSAWGRQGQPSSAAVTRFPKKVWKTRAV